MENFWTEWSPVLQKWAAPIGVMAAAVIAFFVAKKVVIGTVSLVGQGASSLATGISKLKFNNYILANLASFAVFTAGSGMLGFGCGSRNETEQLVSLPVANSLSSAGGALMFCAVVFAIRNIIWEGANEGKKHDIT